MVLSEPETGAETRMASAMGTPLFMFWYFPTNHTPVPSRQPRPMARNHRLTTDNNKKCRWEDFVNGEGRALPAVRGSEQCRDRGHSRACGGDDQQASTSHDGCGDP